MAGRDPIHQTPADTTEVGSHGVLGSNGIGLGEFSDLVFAADVFDSVAFEDKTSGECRASGFPVVGAMTDELGQMVSKDAGASLGQID